MKLAETILDIRPRRTTEIVDLAMVFYRRHLGLLCALSAIFGVPSIVLCAAVHELSGVFWVPWILFVLLLPLTAGAIVLSVGRIVFGADMTVASTLSIYRRMWAPWFFVRMLQTAISLALMPLIIGLVLAMERQYTPMVMLLERLGRRETALRNRVLVRHSAGSGPGFEALVMTTLFVAVVSIMLLLQLMFGELFSLWPDTGLFSEDAFSDPLRTGIWMLVVLAVYPVVVVSRFFRYIDARIRGEGWDLELGFRKAAIEIRRRSLRGGPVLGVLWMLCGQPVEAADSQKAHPSDAQVGRQVDEITDNPSYRWLRDGLSQSESPMDEQGANATPATRRRSW